MKRQTKLGEIKTRKEKTQERKKILLPQRLTWNGINWQEKCLPNCNKECKSLKIT